MFQTDLYSHLAGDEGIAALAGIRVFPLIMEQPAKVPAVVYTQTGRNGDQTMCGPGGLVNVLFMIDSYAKSYEAAHALADAVQTSLDNFRGMMGDTPIASIALESETDLTDPDPGLFRVSQTFNIWHR